MKFFTMVVDGMFPDNPPIFTEWYEKMKDDKMFYWVKKDFEAGRYEGTFEDYMKKSHKANIVGFHREQVL